ncbi:hypothetical protein C2G38_2170110 [Gigaspora rosea]|uniref:Uncharacterized protein n=1 Tax=Gigaspora rosea TaxID=44941 RepID=A0A397VMX8_9GLOM|nr:hypothetical protein C2G38_2170110 [Gigaspora rosea]
MSRTSRPDCPPSVSVSHDNTAANHITEGNGWYEEEEFEVYLAITPNEIDSQEAGAMPQDPTTTQSNSIEDQANATRRPILDEGFARRMEYQDLIMDVVMESEGGAECMVVEEALRPEYKEVLEDLTGEVEWDDDKKLKK